jgi:hypothetical protein
LVRQVAAVVGIPTFDQFLKDSYALGKRDTGDSRYAFGGMRASLKRVQNSHQEEPENSITTSSG